MKCDRHILYIVNFSEVWGDTLPPAILTQGPEAACKFPWHCVYMPWEGGHLSFMVCF
jgi:hypothetical protein